MGDDAYRYLQSMTDPLVFIHKDLPISYISFISIAFSTGSDTLFRFHSDHIDHHSLIQHFFHYSPLPVHHPSPIDHHQLIHHQTIVNPLISP